MKENVTLNMAGRRIVWLDVLKGICMLCTMIGHFPFFPDNVATCYAPFFLSAFLFASGYTFHLENSFISFLYKKVRTILLPWFWMGMLTIVSRLILSFNVHGGGISSQLMDFFLQIRGKGDEGWFFVCLFGSEIVFYLIVLLARRTNRIALVSFIVSLISVAFSLLTNDMRLPWHIQMWGSSCFFLSMGYLIHQHEKESTIKIMNEKYLPLSICLYIICFAFDRYCIGGNAITFYYYGNSILMYYLLSIISVWMIILFAKSVKPCKWLVFVGKNTLLYYGLHGKVGSAFTFIVRKTIGDNLSDITSIVVGIIGLLFIVLTLMPVVYIINAKFGFLLGKKVRRN